MDLGECPITDIRFLPATSRATYEPFDWYKIQDINNMILVTNKRSNSLPITGTILEQTPCMISSEVSQTNAGADFYPLEVSRENICPPEQVTSLQFDPRYINAGMSVTEFDLQQTSGVLTTLRELPLYTRYVPNDTFSKKQIQNIFYRRPTLSWDPKCEYNGHLRADAYQAL